ncbi:RTA1 like protein-domain-containing protein [Lineolata rhizophorae]|uniref:RTA1 like protein-domain-containing protein n=1 Tax=Lineolata rhizophorae TaxID=578093 RepID=A0A6A6PGG7_9PEZI|nr:RTA1 like protein-domain-containing protein [Lineolata rhizophorae]
MGRHVPINLWHYEPNKVAPIVFAVMFATSGAVHFYQTFRYKSSRYTIMLPWAALIMAAGFCLREAGAYDTHDLDIYIAGQVLIMSGPPIYAAIDYFILSRVLFYIPYLSPLHPGRVVTTFIGIDTLIECVIGNGVSRMVNQGLSPSQRAVGEIMVKTAIILQAVMFGVFVYLGVVFHRRCARKGVLSRAIKTVLYTLYFSSTIVTIRCIYRIVEMFQGFDGYIYTHEPLFWVFEASIMFVNTVIFNIWHPGRRLPGDNTIYLSMDGVTERKGPGWKDDRNFLLTIFDPFDLVGICTGKDKKTQFWNMSDEEVEKLIEDRKKNKRVWWKVLLDPFHLCGEKGKITKFRRRGTSDVEAEAGLRGHETELGKTSSTQA